METMQAQVEILNRLESDLVWFQENLKNIQKDYSNRFIAIKKRKIISEGKTVDELVEKLKSKKQDPSEVLIKFVSKIAFIF